MVEDSHKFCSKCGGSSFSEAINENVHTVPKLSDSVQNSYSPIGGQIQAVENIGAKIDSINAEENSGNGNIIAGIVGAFLFSLIGALAYFILYQIGIIAGISALIIFVLADFGYGLFAKTNRNSSSVCLITAIEITVVMIFLSEFFCLSFEVFKVYKGMGISIFDAIRATPEFLSDSEIGGAVAGDLVFA